MVLGDTILVESNYYEAPNATRTLFGLCGDADLTFATLSQTLADFGAPTPKDVVIAPTNVIDDFAAAGVDVMSLATNHRWRDSSGEAVERTDWHRLTFWNKLAEIAEEFIAKGDRLYIEGRVEYGKYTRHDGVEFATVDVHVNQLVMLGTGGHEPDESPSGENEFAF